ncbi:serine hydrolase domain-containing protein [Streptomyces sp. 029-5]|uniref:serine hydrolase domain-containing protein n=1 Tax=Streptomyces sp. 029-5 TaxID=2789261 RepID=UPI00397F0A1D
MTRRAARTALLALAITVSLGAATLTPAYAAPPAAPLPPSDTPLAPLSASGASGASAASAVQGRAHAATQTALRQLVEAGGLPGASAEVRDGDGRWFGAAGLADTDTGRKRSAGDHFRVASITKTFIATVLLQLEAEGRLSLDDTVEKWLPGLVRGNGNDGARITLRQLLNHTSGLFNHTDDPEFAANSSGADFFDHRYDNHRPEDLVSLAMTYPPKYEPGEEPWYSNTNYVLAGMVIEKATGRSYAQETTRRIIEPLKLRETSFPGATPHMPAPHPVGYSRLHDKSPDAEIHDATEQNMSWLGASGDLISTVGDINRFHRALMRGDLLPAAQLRDMLDSVPASDGYLYGLGVESITLTCGVTVTGKTGRTNGSLSAVVSTEDGTHQLTFNINGDWLPDPSLYTNVVEAEYCGRIPAPQPQSARPQPPSLFPSR